MEVNQENLGALSAYLQKTLDPQLETRKEGMLRILFIEVVNLSRAVG